MSRHYWSAFDALRRNKPLAEVLSQLQDPALRVLDREMIPALAQAPATAQAVVHHQRPRPGRVQRERHRRAWPGPAGFAPVAPASPSRHHLGTIPLPGGTFNSDETQLLDRVSPAVMIQRIATSDPVPRSPAPTPGMTLGNRRPEPARSPEPARPVTPPRGQKPVRVAPPSVSDEPPK